jgi:hypothetical protein
VKALRHFEKPCNTCDVNVVLLRIFCVRSVSMRSTKWPPDTRWMEGRVGPRNSQLVACLRSYPDIYEEKRVPIRSCMKVAITGPIRISVIVSATRKTGLHMNLQKKPSLEIPNCEKTIKRHVSSQTAQIWRVSHLFGRFYGFSTTWSFVQKLRSNVTTRR